MPRQEPAEWTAGGKVVHFDRIEWRVIPDSATAAAALQAGEVDWYEQVQADLVPLLRRNTDVAIGSANPTGFNGILRFNHLHPPFNNVAVRRAVLMAINQHDYMAAITGGDSTVYNGCKAVLPCGTPYGREIGAPAMPGNLDQARGALQASGYNGEKVVIISPTDFVTIGPMGDVTYDTLKKLGMNVEIVQTDWGTVTQRRASREPVDKGRLVDRAHLGALGHHRRSGAAIFCARSWTFRLVRLVRRRENRGDIADLAARADRGRARHGRRCVSGSSVRDGAIHSAGSIPDPHRVSQEPDWTDRGHRRVFLEYPPRRVRFATRLDGSAMYAYTSARNA